jgi:hypothetical protein
MTATKQSTDNLAALRDNFRKAVRSGQSGATEYAAWRRTHAEQAAAIGLRNRDGGGRVTQINNQRSTERAWLVREWRALATNREIVGRSIGANVGGQPVIYTAATHNGRVNAWQERLTEYLGRDCSDVEPQDLNSVPFREPEQFTAEPIPAGPREYGAELEAAVTESE